MKHPGNFLGSPRSVAAAFLAALLLPWGASPAVRAGDPRFFFTFGQDGRDCSFEGHFNIRADAQTVWDVLTDFDHRSRFISNLNDHVRQKDGNTLLVDMTAGGGFLFIREEVHGPLKVEEDPLKSLTFEETTHKNFNYYRGTWSLGPLPSDGGIEVSYRMEAETGPSTPSFVKPDLLRQTSEDLMVQMQREMARRQRALKGAHRMNEPRVSGWGREPRSA